MGRYISGRGHMQRFVHILVDCAGQLPDGRWRPGQRLNNLRLALSAMFYQMCHDAWPVFYDRAMAWQIQFLGPGGQFIQRGHESSQIALRWRNHGRGPSHDVIPRKQPRTIGKTQVIIEMSGRMNGFKTPSVTSRDLAVFQTNIGTKGCVDTLATCEFSKIESNFPALRQLWITPINRRGSYMRQRPRKGRMIKMRMRHKYRLDIPARDCGKQGRQMRFGVWTGINDGNGLRTEDITARPGIGHGGRVSRRHNQKIGCQLLRSTYFGPVPKDKWGIAHLRFLHLFQGTLTVLPMNFNWLKRYMPRSLFGRAVLILVVPIVGLQLFVATIFIQRHFDGVTRQLAKGLGLEIAALVDQVESNDGLTEETLDMSGILGLDVQFDRDGQTSGAFLRHWYDISGRVIEDVLETTLERDAGIDLVSDFRRVTVTVPTDAGALTVTARRQRISASNPHQLIVLMIFASIVLTIISLIFLRNQMRPIRRLARAAEAFGKGRSDPFRPAGAEEVRRAGSAFLAMRSRIERQIDQRTRMLSGVSHDLRTPLTRMKLALATADSPEDLQDLQGDVDEMEKMLNEFLSFAKGDQSEITEAVDPFALAAEIADSARRSNLHVDVRSECDEEGPVTVQLRAVAIKRAIQNLVTNAGRYGQKIRITTCVRPRTLSYVVEDDGPGIDPHDTNEAMQAFSRLDEARNQNLGGGVGLGLAITTDIARSHGGSLGLERSEDLGGLKATLTLPR